MSEVSTPQTGAAGPAPPPDQSTTEQAKEKAHEAAGQAKGRAREEIDRRSTDAGEQVKTTADDLRSVGEQLRSQGKETPAKYAEQAAERVQRVGGYLEDSDADRILRDVEDFARRQPWAVVAGGVVLGFAAARFLKASSSERYHQQRGASTSNGGSGGYQRAALPTEGVDRAGRRFTEPDTAVSPAPTPAAGVNAGATPATGVMPNGA